MDESGQVIIPSFNREQFLKTDEPYKWLIQFNNDKFILNRFKEILRLQSKAEGVSGFVGLWNDFYKQHCPNKRDMMSVTDFSDQPMELYVRSWTANDDGVFTRDEKGVEIVACSHPLMPVLRMRNVDTGKESMKIAFRRGKRSWQYVTADKNKLANARSIVDLSSNGIAVTSENAKHIVKYLSEVESENYDEIPEIRSVGRCGWIHDGAFSPYCDDVIFDGADSFADMFNAVTEHGDFDKWLETVSSARERSTIVRIVVAASFASVLLKPIDLLPFIVHLWGGTEAGKTVALMVAASIWGAPEVGRLIRSFNSTNVGMEYLAEFLNSIPLMLDELQIIGDRKDFDGIIYRLCEGTGKTRGKKDGGVQTQTKWKNCTLTTGEMPISNGSSMSGAINRIIEIDCKAEKLFADPVYTANSVKQNYGFAGRMFVDYLTESESHIEYAKLLQRYAYIELTKGTSTEKQSAAASAIIAADTIADEVIFHSGKCLTVDDIKPYLSTKSQVNVYERAYAFLLDYVVINSKCFKANGFDEYAGEVWGKIGSDCVYIIKSQFDKIMQANGYVPAAFLSWAKREGKIKTKSGRNTIMVSVAGSHVNCVALFNGGNSVEPDAETDAKMDELLDIDLPN